MNEIEIIDFPFNASEAEIREVLVDKYKYPKQVTVQFSHSFCTEQEACYAAKMTFDYSHNTVFCYPVDFGNILWSKKFNTLKQKLESQPINPSRELIKSVSNERQKIEKNISALGSNKRFLVAVGVPN